MQLKVFYSYAYEDRILRNQLEKHLATLKRLELITNWHDRNINAGKEWIKEIDANLNTADIILLLISPDFVHSDYCYSMEMKRALERHENGTARVIPIILRHIDFDGAPFSKLQALPKDAVPVTDRKWRNRDEAFLDIARGIRNAVNEMLSEQWVYEGDIHFHRERYQLALAGYKQAIRFDPTNSLAYVGQGQTLIQLASIWTSQYLEYNNEALEAFDLATSLDHTNSYAYAGKGEVLFNLYCKSRKTRDSLNINKDKILDSFNQAIQLDPSNEKAHVGLGNVLCYFSNYEEALAAYETAIEASLFFNQYVYGKKADTLYKLKRYKDALIIYEKIIRECPDKHDIYEEKGNTLYKLGRDEEALSAYEKAISLGLESEVIYIAKGNVLYRLDRYKEALEDYERAIQLSGDFSAFDAYQGKANVLQVLAKEAFEKAESIHPF